MLFFLHSFSAFRLSHTMLCTSRPEGGAVTEAECKTKGQLVYNEKGAVIMKVLVENSESMIKTTVSFLLHRCHSLFFFFAFFYWYKKTQINASFLLHLCWFFFFFTVIMKEGTTFISCVHSPKQYTFTLAVH